ncbi:MAG: hypothetical protein V3T77_03815, partial [Planctomycetota bacterium]
MFKTVHFWLLLFLTSGFLASGVLADAQDTDKATQSPSDPAPSDPAPSVDELIAKFIEASGGAEAISKISTRISEGTVEMPMQGIKASMTFMQKAPGLSVSKMVIPDLMVHREGTKGKIAWELGNSGPRIKDPL